MSETRNDAIVEVEPGIYMCNLCVRYWGPTVRFDDVMDAVEHASIVHGTASPGLQTDDE